LGRYQKAQAEEVSGFFLSANPKDNLRGLFLSIINDTCYYEAHRTINHPNTIPNLTRRTIPRAFLKTKRNIPNQYHTITHRLSQYHHGRRAIACCAATIL